MKELLMVVSLLLSGVVAEAPYPPSGWRPSGPAFELPPQSQPPIKQQYLPPVDPRRPANPSFDDDVDVSVQGLPTVEQQPIFQVSPINGQLYTGPSINSDISKLNPSFQQAQYQQQLEKARQFQRQREFDAARTNSPANGLPNQQSPRQFASQTTTTTTTLRPEFKTTQAETTTESIELNEGETFDSDKNANDQKVSVEVTKQNLQEYPAELFLSPLTQLNQLNVQPQFVRLQQFGQLRAPLYYQSAQVAPITQQGFDGPAHLSALPSVLAQRELLAQQAQLQNQGFAQNPIIVQQEQAPLVQEPLNQYQPIINQYQPVQPEVQAFPQYQPQQVIVQPQTLNQVQPNQYPQVQPNPLAQPIQPNQFAQQIPQYPQQIPQYPQQIPQYPQQIQPNQFPQQVPQNQFPQQIQPNQFQPQKPKDVEELEQNDQQVVYQNYQPQFYQPQFQPSQYQNAEQPLILAQPVDYQKQDLNQFYATQYQQQQYDPGQFSQPQDALQSGLDINQQGNGIDETDKEQDNQEDEGPQVTAVATAFGTRTQPRVFAQYGSPIPRVQANPGYPNSPTTTESPQEETTTENGPTIAQATAVSSGRRNAKLRSRRVRPIFTLDKSGHLVLAQQQ